MTDGGGNGTLGAIVQQVEAATACVQAADTAPALRAEAAGFCERVRDTCGAAQLCALAHALCTSPARTTASLHYALQLLERAATTTTTTTDALTPPQRAELQRFLLLLVADAPLDGSTSTSTSGLLSACLAHSYEQYHAVAGKAAAVLAAALARADPSVCALAVRDHLVPQLRAPRTVAVAAAARTLRALVDAAEGAAPALAPARRRALGTALRAAVRAPTALCAQLAGALAWLGAGAEAAAAAGGRGAVPRRAVLGAVRSVLDLAAAHVRTASKRQLRDSALADVLAAVLAACVPDAGAPGACAPAPAAAALPWDVAGGVCDVLLAWTQRALPVQYGTHAPALVVLLSAPDRVLAEVLALVRRAEAACAPRPAVAPAGAPAATMDGAQQAAFAVLVKGAEVLAATALAARAYCDEYPRYALPAARARAVVESLVALARHPAPEVARLVHGVFAALCRATEGTSAGAAGAAGDLLPDSVVAQLLDAALARFRLRAEAAYYRRGDGDGDAADDAVATREFLAALTRRRPVLFFEHSLRLLLAHFAQLSAATAATATATDARRALGLGLDADADTDTAAPQSLAANPCLVFLETSIRSLRDGNGTAKDVLAPDTRAALEQFVALVLQYRPRAAELRYHAHVLAALVPLLPRTLPAAADSAFRKGVEYYTLLGAALPVAAPLFEETRYEVLRLLKTMAARLALSDSTVEQFVAWYQSTPIGPHDRHHFVPVLVNATFVSLFLSLAWHLVWSHRCFISFL